MINKIKTQTQEKPSNLEIALTEFDLAVDELLKNPCQATALKANLASLKWFEILSNIERHDGGIPMQLANQYRRDVDRCLAYFKKIPNCGHTHNYALQMVVRKSLIRKFIKY